MKSGGVPVAISQNQSVNYAYPVDRRLSYPPVGWSSHAMNQTHQTHHPADNKSPTELCPPTTSSYHIPHQSVVANHHQSMRAYYDNMWYNQMNSPATGGVVAPPFSFPGVDMLSHAVQMNYAQTPGTVL